MHDDLGFSLEPSGPARRVVSLVPSLTEAIATTRPEALAGATDWCTHPSDLQVPRVRGTKNPDLAAIKALAPDLVIANKEENRQLDIERLRAAGIRVWVTDIETLDQAFASMRRLFVEALGWEVPSWLIEAERIWSEPAPKTNRRVGVAIWRDPWMVVGRDTFTGDLLSRVGVVHTYADADGRYPHIDLAELDSGHLELLLLPDEPYVFTSNDGPEAFSRTPTVLCSGRALTWYGPSLVTARHELMTALRPA